MDDEQPKWPDVKVPTTASWSALAVVPEPDPAASAPPAERERPWPSSVQPNGPTPLPPWPMPTAQRPADQDWPVPGSGGPQQWPAGAEALAAGPTPMGSSDPGPDPALGPSAWPAPSLNDLLDVFGAAADRQPEGSDYPLPDQEMVTYSPFGG